MRTEIKKWGNSAAIRLPAKVLAEAQLEVNRSISMIVKDRKIIIEAAQEPGGARLALPYSEQDLVSELTPENAHSELLAEPIDDELGE